MWSLDLHLGGTATRRVLAVLTFGAASGFGLPVMVAQEPAGASSPAHHVTPADVIGHWQRQNDTTGTSYIFTDSTYTASVGFDVAGRWRLMGDTVKLGNAKPVDREIVVAGKSPFGSMAGASFGLEPLIVVSKENRIALTTKADLAHPELWLYRADSAKTSEP